MSKILCLIALTFIATTSSVWARGGQQGGPIGPGSVYGLQPSARDDIATDRAPVVRTRSKKSAKQK